jgi:4-amino-4-deoxy-L-arabinose transferase-like glycosyltransferase
MSAFLLARRGRSFSPREAAAFGALLGTAYLAKSVLLPVSVATFIVYVLVALRRQGRAAARELGIAVLAFAAVAAPLVAVQSRAQGRLSFGESGRLNYRWFVSRAGENRARHEPPAVTAQRTEADPAPVALESIPGAILYAGELRGSYPHGFDPSHSEPNDDIRFSIAGQRQVLGQNLLWLRVIAGSLFLLAAIPLMIAVLDRRAPRVGIWGIWPAAVPPATLLTLYLLTHVEGRLCGPAIVTLLVLLVYAVPLAAPRRGTAVGAQMAAVVLLGTLVLLRTFTGGSFAGRGGPKGGQAAVARAAAARGLRAGETVAVIGSPYGLYWAHLAGVRIALVIPPPPAANPLDGSALDRVAAESCARGVPLAAVAWRSDGSSLPGAEPLDAGWQMWRPRHRCASAEATAGAAVMPY